ncbi:C4b-binding protein alpha chain-like isoform X2 [Heterodontus francisci]|uniref:C4b-binding protein alpha chain-like isoform X2 n=1 Tax=Heterodontus francisci TaxID=7792 RepID=UPI00355C90D5
MAERLILALMAICTVGVAWVTGDCGKAPTLENGSPTDDFISSTSFPVSTKVVYKCYPGYVFREGSSRSVLCMEDSTWAPLRAICELKNCGNPGEILNGYYEATNTTFGSIATFFCSDGYRLVGTNYRKCTVDGWSGQVPRCEIVKCADPPSIANGKVRTPSQTSDWEYGMIAKYLCSESYTLIGAAELICTKTGMWNTDPPICKVVQCKRPELPANIEIVSGFGPMYKYQEEITFRCSNNYEMVGKSVIECSADSTFVPQPPTCILRTTIPPAVISTRAGTTTTTITATTKAGEHENRTGLIVGIFCGIILVGVVVSVGLWYRKKKERQNMMSEKVAMNSQSEQVEVQ